MLSVLEDACLLLTSLNCPNFSVLFPSFLTLVVGTHDERFL